MATTTAAIAGSLKRVTASLTTSAQYGHLAANLKQTTGSITVVNTTTQVSVAGALRKVTGSIQLTKTTTPGIIINGQIHKLSGSITTENPVAISIVLKKLTSSQHANAYSPYITINGQIRRLAALITTLPQANVLADLRKVTGSSAARIQTHAGIFGSLQKLSGSITLDRAKTYTMAASLPRLTGSASVDQQYGIIAAQLPRLTAAIDVSQSTYIIGQLKPLSGAITFEQFDFATIDGQLRRVTGIQLEPVTLTAQLRRVSAAIYEQDTAAVGAALRPITASASLTIVPTAPGSITAALSKLSSTISVALRETVTIDAQLHRLHGGRAGGLKPITGHIVVGTPNIATLAAHLKPLTGTINTGRTVAVQLTGQLRGITGALIGGFTDFASLAAQLKKIAASAQANRRHLFALQAQIRLTANMTASQSLAPFVVKPTSIFTKKINITNPASKEPILASVVYNGINFMDSTDNVELGPYDDPSVDQILHGLVAYSHLGDIQNGAGFNGSSAITINAQSAATPLSDPTVTISVLPTISALPPGLTFQTVSNGVARITGTVSDVPLSAKRYEFMIRVTNSLNVKIDRWFYFDVIPPTQQLAWTGPYDLGDVRRGNFVNIDLPITNSLQLPLTYTVSPSLPANLVIASDKITGIVNANTVLQQYTFTITATDGTNTTISPTFSLNVISGTTTVQLSSNAIIWQTDSNLGSTYVLMASHFAIKATNPGGHTVTYALAPYSTPLPSGVSLNATTGELVGIMPFSTQDQSYSFTARASVGAFYNDRLFTLTVLHQYSTSTVVTAYLPVEEPARLVNAMTIWNPNTISDSIVFRPQRDDNFGRILQPRLVLGTRSVPTVSSMQAFAASVETTLSKYVLQEIVEYDPVAQAPVTEYINGLHVTLGTLGTSPVYGPDGRYLYDVVYANVLDAQSKAGGFVNGVEAQIMASKLRTPFRVYPKSLNNLRQAWLTFANPADTADAGLSLWQRSTGKGWQATIELVYANAGQGRTVLNNMQISGVADALVGLEWTTGSVRLEQIS
jgi:hypothetical protein